MSESTTEFAEFAAIHLQGEGWQTAETWPSTWIYDPVTQTWVHDNSAPDPYDLIPRVGEIVKVDGLNVMLHMTGWATKIEEDDEDEDEETRVRCRILLKAGPYIKPQLAVQMGDKPFEIMDNMGEGMFPELFRAELVDN